MLTEKRHTMILEAVNRSGSVKLGELCELLKTSESTVRRDLNILSEKGMLTKVHGGAIALTEKFSRYENNVSTKVNLCAEEKSVIAQYAAELVEDGDFIYLDAGTTTEKMIDYISPNKKVTFVTNGFINAKKLAQNGFTVYIPGGEIKALTEAVVGAECVLSLESYNFTKCFMGVNGISISRGLTTHDKSEAAIKSTAILHSKEVYILADHSKFDRITPVCFAPLDCGTIITDGAPDKKYAAKTSIREVL